MMPSIESHSMDEQVLDLIKEGLKDIKDDIKSIKETFEKHAEQDREVWQEVWFVKKLLYGAWIGLLGLFGWKGLH